jgi:hypothetical protein
MRSHHQFHPTKLARAYQHEYQEIGELEKQGVSKVLFMSLKHKDTCHLIGNASTLTENFKNLSKQTFT